MQKVSQMRKDQKVIRKDNNQLVVKNYPKIKKQPIQQPKVKPTNCPSCRRNYWFEFDKGYYCRNCEYIVNKQKHQIDKKKFVDKIILFLPNCLKLIKTLEKLIFLWLILLINQQKI